MDYTKFNKSKGHDDAEHARAGESPYLDVVKLAVSRFEANPDEFFAHFNDPDPNARDNMLHLLRSFTMGMTEQTLKKYQDQGQYDEIDETATMMIVATFGFIVGRTFQEHETIRLVKEDKLVIQEVPGGSPQAPS